MLPAMRCWPRPRSTSTRVVSSSLALSWGVSVPRTSAIDANALTIKLTGEVTLWVASPSRHWVRMDKLSLPTGIEMPKAGHNSSPTACTVS